MVFYIRRITTVPKFTLHDFRRGQIAALFSLHVSLSYSRESRSHRGVSRDVIARRRGGRTHTVSRRLTASPDDSLPCPENTRAREVTRIYHAKARCETGVVYCLDGTWDKRARCLREDLRELVRLLPFMLLPRSRFRGLPFLTVTSPHALRSHWLQLVADLQMPRRASLTRDRVVHT